MVVHVISDQPAKTLLVQRHDMIEDLAAATFHPAFRDAKLSGRLHARLFGVQTRRLREGDRLGTEFRITNEDHVAMRSNFWAGLTQPLHKPLRSRMAGDIEVQDLPSPMLDDEETVEPLESHRGHRKEVESNNHLAVVPEEGQPPFTWITPATDSP
jgi:hypothetical protein